MKIQKKNHNFLKHKRAEHRAEFHMQILLQITKQKKHIVWRKVEAAKKK